MTSRPAALTAGLCRSSARRNRKISRVIERAELVLVVLGLVLIAAGWAQTRYRYVTGRRRGRRFYWTTSAIGVACFALGVGWPNAVVVALIFTAIVTGSAYLSTPYLKVGGRIYALDPADREPDPSDPER